MRRARIYIAGPITKGPLDVNINQATDAFIALTKAGAAPMCPHWSCYSGRAMVRPDDGAVYAVAGVTPNDLKHEDWYGCDLAWVEASDAVLRLPGASVGADGETIHATKNSIPVFGYLADVLHWLEEWKAAQVF